MRKFSINCDFGGQLAPFDVFIGQPEQSHHPLHFQADWLLKQRGGTILPEVMEAIAKLNTLALENGVPLEDLCVYALGSAQEETAPEGNATSTEETVSDDSQIEDTAAEESVIEPTEPQPSQKALSTNDSALEVTQETDASENNQGNISIEESQTPIEETLDSEVIPGNTEEKDEALDPLSKANEEPPTDENKQ